MTGKLIISIFILLFISALCLSSLLVANDKIFLEEEGSGVAIEDDFFDDVERARLNNERDDVETEAKKKKAERMAKRTAINKEMTKKCHCVFNLCLTKVKDNWEETFGLTDSERKDYFEREEERLRSIKEKNEVQNDICREWAKNKKSTTKNDSIDASYLNRINEIDQAIRDENNYYENINFDIKIQIKEANKRRREQALNNIEEARNRRNKKNRSSQLENCKKSWATGNNPCDCSSKHAPAWVRNASTCDM